MPDSGSAPLLDCNDNSTSHRLKRMSKGSSSLGHKSSSHEAATMDVCYRLLGMAIMRLVPMNFEWKCASASQRNRKSAADMPKRGRVLMSGRKRPDDMLYKVRWNCVRFSYQIRKSSYMIRS